jgi:hypothetical protein
MYIVMINYLYSVKPALVTPLLNNNLYYVTLNFISLHSAFIIHKTYIKRPLVLCDHISLFPWNIT